MKQQNEGTDEYITIQDGKEGVVCNVKMNKWMRDPNASSLVADRIQTVEPCGQFISAKYGNTSGIIHHLQTAHRISKPQQPEEVHEEGGTLRKFLELPENSSLPITKKYTFRENTAKVFAKKYLPFSFLENDKLLLEWLESYRTEANNGPVELVSRNTIAQDTVNLAAAFQKQESQHWLRLLERSQS